MSSFGSNKRATRRWDLRAAVFATLMTGVWSDAASAQSQPQPQPQPPTSLADRLGLAADLPRGELAAGWVVIPVVESGPSLRLAPFERPEYALCAPAGQHRAGNWWLLEAAPPLALQMAEVLRVWWHDPAQDCLASVEVELASGTEASLLFEGTANLEARAGEVDFLPTAGAERIELGVRALRVLDASGRELLVRSGLEPVFTEHGASARISRLGDGSVVLDWRFGEIQDSCCTLIHELALREVFRWAPGSAEAALLMKTERTFELDAPEGAFEDAWEDAGGDPDKLLPHAEPQAVGPGHECTTAVADQPLLAAEETFRASALVPVPGGLLWRQVEWRDVRTEAADIGTLCGQSKWRVSGGWSWFFLPEVGSAVELSRQELSDSGPFVEHFSLGSLAEE